MYINAVEMKSNKMDILSSELFNISDLKEFEIILKNIKGQSQIINLGEWKDNQ